MRLAAPQRAGHAPPAAFVAALALACLADPAAHAAHAAIVNMRATLSGAQTVPPNGSPGTGSAKIRIDTQVNGLVYNISYANLTSPETVSFIHGYAPPGMNAGSRHQLPAGNPKIATWIYPEADEANILAGLAYVLIHTTMFPTGEIRGQVVPALPPEGTDFFDTTAQIQVELYGIGGLTLNVAGPTVVQRGEPVPSGAAETQSAEILSVQWTGTHPLLGNVTVRESDLYASTGLIVSAPGTAFPATSTFDAYLEIATASGTFINRNRLRLAATIDAIPPTGDTYTGNGILLYRDGPTETSAGRILGITLNPGATFVAVPPAGTDCLDSELHMQLTVTGTGVEHIIGFGRFMLTRGSGVDPGDGRLEVPLEMVALNLAGTGQVLGAVDVVEIPAQPSTGLAKSTAPGAVFPMNVDLDSHIEIELPTLGRTVVPQVPPHLHGQWNAVPQIGIAIDATNVPMVVLDKATGMPAGTLDFFYIVPDSTCTWSPAAAVEQFTASGNATVELFGAGTAAVALGGSATVVRGAGRDTGGGTLVADTEMRSLFMSGSAAPVGAIALEEDPRRVTTGSVTGSTTGALLPATAGFAAFVAVHTASGVLRPAAAITLAASGPINALPFPAGTSWALRRKTASARKSIAGTW